MFSTTLFYRKTALNIAKEEGMRIHEGIYVMSGGPQYETPAEVGLYKILGADALGRALHLMYACAYLRSFRNVNVP